MRQTTLGGAVIILAVLAPFLVRRRFAAPFFCVLTVIPLILALHETPLHSVFYLIPGFETFREHDPWRVYSVATIGPAMLSGAVVNELPRLRGQRQLLSIVLLPLLLMAIAAYILDEVEDFIGWQPLIAAALATAALIFAVAWPREGRLHQRRDVLTLCVAGVIVAAIYLQPTATELTGSWFGWPKDASWEERWDSNPEIARALEIETSSADPGGAGEFLQQQLEAEGPFRYVGYGGFGFDGPNQPKRTYTERRLEPSIQAILVNGRPIFLHLYEIQGYNPLELERYVDFMTAINGRPQNYHFAYLFDSGVDSPLLNLLNVRYFLVAAALPDDRVDVADIIRDKRMVFHNEHVDVYENPNAYPHAWIVHDVRQLPEDEILHELRHGAIDPRRTAYVEETPPLSQPPADPAADLAQVLRLEPDRLSVATRSDAPGLLVLSEVYDPGWRAYVDDREVDVLATNYILRGVPIPAGEHTVELRYEPTSLRVGVGISAVATLALLATLMVSAWPLVRRVAPRRVEQTGPVIPVEHPELSGPGRGGKRPTGGMAK